MRRAEPEDPTGDQLTDRQRRIMQVIEDSVRRRGYPPAQASSPCHGSPDA